jgi:hypothetical protein
MVGAKVGAPHRLDAAAAERFRRAISATGDLGEP